jgi:glycosyltransferase involved in cell wall biosynthesis
LPKYPFLSKSYAKYQATKLLFGRRTARAIMDRHAGPVAKAALLQPFEAPAARPAAAVLNRPSIALIGVMSLPQCRMYRVMQKRELFGEMGIPCETADWRDHRRARTIVQTATLVILYRVTRNPFVDELFRECARLGVPVFYDIDDPVFDETVYAQNENLASLAARERRQLIGQCAPHLEAMRGAEAIMVSTPGLARIAERATGRKTIVVPNLVDSEILNVAGQIAAPDVRDLARLRAHLSGTAPLVQKGDRVTIGYFSGSRAHDADFAIVADALRTVMAANPRVALLLAGHLAVPAGLPQERVTLVPFASFASYMRLLATVDIAIVPLVDSAFNSGKSAIRYLEAGLMEAAVVASAVGQFPEVVVDGETAILARNSEEWVSALGRLISDGARRRSMGVAARIDILKRWSVWSDLPKRALADTLQAMVARRGADATIAL